MPPKVGATVKNKPGNKGDFHGRREELLQSKIPEYLELSKKGKTRDFWGPLMKTYWEQFHWHLPLNEDPSENRVFPSDVTLKPEDVLLKAKMQKAIKQVSFGPICERAQVIDSSCRKLRLGIIIDAPPWA
jgi:hypothetical protein